MQELKKRLVLSLVALLVFSTFLVTPVAASNTVNPIDTDKEIIYYLFYTEDDTLKAEKENLKSTLQLTDEEMETIATIGLNQHLNNKEATVQHTGIERSAVHGYNTLVATEADIARDNLSIALGDKYERLREWMSAWWDTEIQRQYNEKTQLRADIGTIKVWATQYYPNTSGAKEVALPDKYVKFANLGWDDTYPDSPYTVDLYYPAKDNSLSNVHVDEVGPWNENDNYWSDDRRDWSDLDLGVPEAHAAYYDDYNDGKDQFGRTVTNPAGIDLSVTAAKRLGFATTNTSAWIEVTYDDLPS